MAIQIIRNASIDTKRRILDSSKGQFFSVEFVKKDGSLRQLTAKTWIKKHLRGKPGENVNTVAHKPEYYTACDANEGYKNINLNTLKRAVVAGKEYIFE